MSERPTFTRRRAIATGAAAAASAALLTPASATATTTGDAKPGTKPTIVLVHGGYADSSCWNGVIQELQGQGYTTIAGSNPLRGIPTDAPYIGSLLDSISGPVVLVAHSMGGTVITNAAAGKSNVKALVYIAAFVPDVGETQGELIGKFPGSEVLPVSVPVPYTKPDGTTGTDLYLSKDGQAAFAADVSPATFRLLQATQRPFDADSFIYPTQAAAWRTIPSWGLVAGQDKAIPPAAERWMYSRANFRKVVEVPTSSHVAMISHPETTAQLIVDAARATR
ncbi:alpha/beta hydrolase (plasmid) [Streptomyces sp. NBC_00841]|uniref:alpha/beta fold hydrolase n=1 Tax=unclassified Streptomyces TaxID=2593676 RepID=UPI00224D4F8A|nr:MULTISPECIES: alpha/beta hydrolase [unclassified Streptomyces]MCX4538424.1 alpha/beta hydrolase [Streptomyces sp. NBC_01669]WSA05743.1 alpha/beta hydrolase [Streptomyces sp. NBC_00841]